MASAATASSRSSAPALDDIALCALERDPARRFATARELARKLTCLLADERISAGLPELSDFIADMFPNGRMCAQQLRYTVERMDAGAPPEDGNERPTVASPLSGPPPISEDLRRPPDTMGRSQTRTSDRPPRSPPDRRGPGRRARAATP